jgi:hypothetical protein
VLTSLQVLDLSDTDVSDEGVSQLRHCRRLERLELCNTDAGDGCAASLGGLVSGGWGGAWIPRVCGGGE